MNEYICDSCANRTTKVRIYHVTDTYGTIYSNGDIARVGCKASRRNPNTVREAPLHSCIDYRPRKAEI